MKWAEISVITSDNLKSTVINIFFENNFKGIQEKRDIYSGKIIITSYAEDNSELNDKIKNLRDYITALNFFGIDEEVEINISSMEDDNWATAWKKYYKPFNIGNIVIKPSWEKYKPKDNEKILEIDPDIAFGTGQHPTTELCINAIADYIKPTDVIIDAGCGSGILCLAANLFGFDHGYAFDIEESAIKVSQDNFKKNNINNITCFRASSPVSIPEKADIIFANIIASVIKGMAKDLADKLKTGGILIASGIIDTRYEEIKDLFDNLGLETIEKRTNKEWVCFILKKIH
ncbi:MAG: 50S ribosomal protein L11 methyltransferase [Armatimonadetes bacterium]|nr:50S ribosomal protein L11 methyltransferase [Candidatus Hippobium faecium]